jgi:hypothetical protein
MSEKFIVRALHNLRCARSIAGFNSGPDELLAQGSDATTETFC